MFRRSQRIYDAVYAWKDYPAEAERIDAAIRERRPDATTLLDVACGSGKHLELLRDRYRVEGVDLDPEMLEIARHRLGPEVPLHVGDMCHFDLGREFDAVTCLFSSIGYARTEENLRRAVATLARHAGPGGVVLVEPWFTPDQWEPGHLTANFIDEPDLKIARLALSGPASSRMTLRFHYLVGTVNGVEHFTEDHEVGMFDHEQYVEAFRAAGVEPEHETDGPMGRGLYVGVRPA